VPAGFYYTYKSSTVVNTCPETCRSCNGKGVIFDTDCFYPYTNTPLPDDYTFDYGTICASNSCSNCGHNDCGMVDTSNTVKYKCALTNEWHEAGHTCKDWCGQCLKLFTGTDVPDISDYISLTNLNATGTEESTVEFVNGTNTTEQTAD